MVVLDNVSNTISFHLLLTEHYNKCFIKINYVLIIFNFKTFERGHIPGRFSTSAKIRHEYFAQQLLTYFRQKLLRIWPKLKISIIYPTIFSVHYMI